MYIKIDPVSKVIMIDGEIPLPEFLDFIHDFIGNDEDKWVILPQYNIVFEN